VGEKMQNKIEVHGKEYNKDAVEILAGKRGETKLDKSMIPIIEAIDNPSELPFLIADINSMKTTDSLRLALVRVQVQSELMMHEDLNKYQKRLYVAQAIEKMLWGELLMDGGNKKKKKKDDEKKEK
jgi:hypothetical protein